MFAQLTAFAQQLFHNREMRIVIVVMGICLFVVYTIRRLSVDNAWKIGIVLGGLVYVILLVVGCVVMRANISYVGVIIGTIVSVLISFVLEFFVFAVDYSRTENLQFEDDEYFYYVKAVPKVNVAAPEKTVKRINERQGTEKMDDWNRKMCSKAKRMKCFLQKRCRKNLRFKNCWKKN